eukprot:CAMPEP_0117675220 /NCGR_PEP_ID=MMETSP0804-20121206/15483_1 /TAXON_ID=1074897 /ORGANISM="Tetraselmis astigmatica, Strain CCMP880" /LENGTH=35 /DNA_ID= /DNA_START= /DNA_END= /DNA_ORIENTATION=
MSSFSASLSMQATARTLPSSFSTESSGSTGAGAYR